MHIPTPPVDFHVDPIFSLLGPFLSLFEPRVWVRAIFMTDIMFVFFTIFFFSSRLDPGVPCDERLNLTSNWNESIVIVRIAQFDRGSDCFCNIYTDAENDQEILISHRHLNVVRFEQTFTQQNQVELTSFSPAWQLRRHETDRNQAIFWFFSREKIYSYDFNINTYYFIYITARNSRVELYCDTTGFNNGKPFLPTTTTTTTTAITTTPNTDINDTKTSTSKHETASFSTPGFPSAADLATEEDTERQRTEDSRNRHLKTLEIIMVVVISIAIGVIVLLVLVVVLGGISLIYNRLKNLRDSIPKPEGFTSEHVPD